MEVITCTVGSSNLKTSLAVMFPYWCQETTAEMACKPRSLHAMPCLCVPS